MNATQLKNEFEECLTYYEYANDFNSVEYFDAKIVPYESEYFELSEVIPLYHYCCYKNITLDKMYCYDKDGLSFVWLDMADSILGIGVDLLSAANDLLDTLEQWYALNCTRL
jgi:hypothetical protein